MYLRENKWSQKRSEIQKGKMNSQAQSQDLLSQKFWAIPNLEKQNVKWRNPTASDWILQNPTLRQDLGRWLQAAPARGGGRSIYAHITFM